jgi:hypothetical protein
MTLMSEAQTQMKLNILERQPVGTYTGILSITLPLCQRVTTDLWVPLGDFQYQTEGYCQISG